MFRSSKALTSERKPFDIPRVSCLCAPSHVEKDAAHERKPPCVLCAQVASHPCERSHGEGAATSWGRFSWAYFHLAAFLCEFSGAELILTCSRKLSYSSYICTIFQIIREMSHFCCAVVSVKVFSQVLCS